MKFIPSASRNHFQGSAWQASYYRKCFSHTCSLNTPPNGSQGVVRRGNQGDWLHQKLAFSSSLRVCVQPGTQEVAPSGNVGSGFYHGGSGEKGCCLGSGASAVKHEAGSELLWGSGTDWRLWFKTVLGFRFNELERAGGGLCSLQTVGSTTLSSVLYHAQCILLSSTEET